MSDNSELIIDVDVESAEGTINSETADFKDWFNSAGDESDNANPESAYDTNQSISDNLERVAGDIASSLGRFAVKKGQQIVSRIDAEADKTTVVTHIEKTTVKETVREKERVKEVKEKKGCLESLITLAKIFIIGAIVLFIMEALAIGWLRSIKPQNTQNAEDIESGAIMLMAEDIEKPACVHV